jgi:hypothetical protein
MIAICYSENNTYGAEVDLSGTSIDLRSVGCLILDLLQSERIEAIMHVVEINPTPYARCLSALLIRKNGGAVKVSVTDNVLEVIGDSERLTTFAAWFDFPDDSTVGYHVHHDPSVGETWVHPDSTPLVIRVETGNQER